MVAWTRAVAIFTFFLVVANAISDWFIFQQGADTRRAQSYTEEQLRASVALLGIVPAAGIDTAGNPTYGFLVQYQNQGGTRALDFQYWASVHYFPDKIPNNFYPSRPYDEIPLRKAPLGPNGISSVSVGLAKANGDEAIAGKGVVLLWGKGSYSTIYKPDTRLPFAFCYLMVPTKIPKSTVSGDHAASPAAVGVSPPITGSIVWDSQLYRQDCNYTD